MRTKRTTRYLFVLMLGVMASSGRAAESKGKLLNRSIYMPIDFELCEHLDGAVFYENDSPVSVMPAARIFQFTYYPELERLLPESVRIRVEGAYVEDNEPFVAKLAVTVDGVHTARSVQSVGTPEQVRKQRHKIDARLKPRTFKLSCKRFCKRGAQAAGQ